MTDIRDDAPSAHSAPTTPSLTPSAASGIAEALARALSGRYDVQREIGRGGSALVYLAHDRARNAQVAIKVLRPEFAHALYADRFVREVEIARRLDHPSILPLLESGTLGDLPYFVMPYVEGDTLRDRLRRERHLSIDDALRIACAVAETLDYAHRIGLVHRDIKPANILLGPNGVVVADFGIARAIAESAVLGPAAITVGTPSGVAIGTPEYMSPEQATADSSVDGRADIYSLGCVLYEMLAGEPPFGGVSPQAIVAKHLHQPPPALRVVRPTISLAFQRTIEKAMAKVPADRFGTAGDFAAALAAAPRDERAPPRRRRALAAIAIVAVIAVAGTLIAPRAASAWRRHAASVHYESGLAAIDRWDLTEADSAFRRASERDPQDPRTFLNLALVRAWRGAAPGQWRYAAERASQNGRLSDRDRLVVAALSQQAIGRRDIACDRWRELTRRAPREFVGWYGLGDCMAWDSVVVRDARATGGWRFRSSSQDALRAFERAIELRETISGSWVVQARGLLHVNPSWVRVGRAEPADTTTFVASASWTGDTVSVEPLPAALFDQSSVAHVSRADEAALHARQRFHAIAQMWRARFPSSSDALEAVAVALDLLANPSAFDTLRVVRQRARTDADRLRLGVMEVLLRTKYAVPDQLDELRLARRLADSLLRAYEVTVPEQAAQLGSLAALTGRAALAARYARLSWGSAIDPALEASAPALLAYASLGGPPDSLRVLALAAERGIETRVVTDAREDARAQWMVRSSLLALPDSGVAALLPAGNQPPLDLLTAWRNRDLGAVQRILARWRSDPRRSSTHASDLTLDVLYSEAAALASLGDAAGAIATLGPTLDSLSLATPQRLADVPRAGALVRAMILRARLAANSGDGAAARRWSRPALLLWSDADDFLKPALEPLRRLVPQH